VARLQRERGYSMWWGWRSARWASEGQWRPQTATTWHWQRSSLADLSLGGRDRMAVARARPLPCLSPSAAGSSSATYDVEDEEATAMAHVS
jgi:hypothetical protein